MTVAGNCNGHCLFRALKKRHHRLCYAPDTHSRNRRLTGLLKLGWAADSPPWPGRPNGSSRRTSATFMAAGSYVPLCPRRLWPFLRGRAAVLRPDCGTVKSFWCQFMPSATGAGVFLEPALAHAAPDAFRDWHPTAPFLSATVARCDAQGLPMHAAASGDGPPQSGATPTAANSHWNQSPQGRIRSNHPGKI